jgi:hypothetical protein
VPDKTANRPPRDVAVVVYDGVALFELAVAGSADNLRKHFHRAVPTTPQAYRRTFRVPAPASV